MKKLLRLVLFLAVVAAVVLYAAGAFRHDQVRPGRVAPPEGEAAPAATTVAGRTVVSVHEDAVGTVESRTKIVVSAQVQARIRSVKVDAGASVEANEVLALLDDRELSAKQGQAKEALAQAVAAVGLAQQSKARAEAVLVQARQRHERVQSLKEAAAATPEQLEDAEAGFLQAQAGVAEADAAIAAAKARVEQAKQGVAEADVALGYATIVSPISGVISLKAVQSGDLAWPGKTLFEIIDPEELRLEAQVREGLIGDVKKGQDLEVRIPAIDLAFRGQVAELCPTADPMTRTFRVRVDIEPRPGLRPGMFGRLRIPFGRREVVEVDDAAVSRTGQLTSVLVRTDQGWQRRLVKLGESLGKGRVEVLSGLRGGETVGLRETR